MLTLQKPDLVERLEEVATAQSIPPEELLNKVVSDYLNNVANQKIRAENAAFEKLHDRLVPKYLGEYVAIHDGEVIDHDTDVRALHLRIRKHFGRTSILLRKVAQELEQPELVFRSPKLELPIE